MKSLISACTQQHSSFRDHGALKEPQGNTSKCNSTLFFRYVSSRRSENSFYSAYIIKCPRISAPPPPIVYKPTQNHYEVTEVVGFYCKPYAAQKILQYYFRRKILSLKLNTTFHPSIFLIKHVTCHYSFIMRSSQSMCSCLFGVMKHATLGLTS